MARATPIPRAELRRIALARIRDAECLYASKRYDGARYVCGYAVEIALKARVCRHLNWSEFLPPDLDEVPMLSLMRKLREIKEEIDAERGGIILLALLQRENASGMVDILFSAAWISRSRDERPALEYLTKKLQDRLTDRELLSISVVVVLRYGEPFIQLVLDLLREEGNPSHLTNVDLNGMLMTNAYFIAADLSDTPLPAETAAPAKKRAGARDGRRPSSQPSAPGSPAAATQAARSRRVVARRRKLPAR